jgi:hypothetical protein
MPRRLSILGLFYRAMADEPLFSSGKERSVQLPWGMRAWQVDLEQPEFGRLNTSIPRTICCGVAGLFGYGRYLCFGRG